jgi:hypothetical protein
MTVKVAKGMKYPPMVYSKAPSRGPKSMPIPFAASMYPMFSSLSLTSNELKIAMLAVEFAPAPKPPNIWARKLKSKNLV